MRPAASICKSEPSHDDANAGVLMRKRIQFFALLAIAVARMFTLSACSSGGGDGN
jgi:hypothetical protein